MRVVFCHRAHMATDYAIGKDIKFAPGQAIALRDEFAVYLAQAVPQRLCLIPEGEDAGQHLCRLTEEIKRETEEAQKTENVRAHEEHSIERIPAETEMLPAMSAQNREKLRQAAKRNRTLREQIGGAMQKPAHGQR